MGKSLSFIFSFIIYQASQTIELRRLYFARLRLLSITTEAKKRHRQSTQKTDRRSYESWIAFRRETRRCVVEDVVAKTKTPKRNWHSDSATKDCEIHWTHLTTPDFSKFAQSRCSHFTCKIQPASCIYAQFQISIAKLWEQTARKINQIETREWCSRMIVKQTVYKQD